MRFGKVLLDTPGLAGFKRANPWVADLDVLPSTQIYVRGERVMSFAGGGVSRLEAIGRRTFAQSSRRTIVQRHAMLTMLVGATAGSPR